MPLCSPSLVLPGHLTWQNIKESPFFMMQEISFPVSLHPYCWRILDKKKGRRVAKARTKQEIEDDWNLLNEKIPTLLKSRLPPSDEITADKDQCNKLVAIASLLAGFVNDSNKHAPGLTPTPTLVEFRGKYHSATFTAVESSQDLLCRVLAFFKIAHEHSEYGEDEEEEEEKESEATEEEEKAKEPAGQEEEDEMGLINGQTVSSDKKPATKDPNNKTSPRTHKARFWLEYLDSTWQEYIVLDDLAAIIDLGKVKLRLREEGEEEAIGIHRSAEQQRPWYWSYTFLKHASWVDKGYEMTRYRSLELGDNAALLQDLLALVKMPPGVVKQAFAIHNEQLYRSFETYQAMLTGKWRQNSHLFKLDDWRHDPIKHQHRALVHARAQQLIGQQARNDGEAVAVVPMLQGTSEEAVWQICQTGFAAVATLDDGWYGRGIYFTSQFEYARYYAKPNDLGMRPVLVALVIPGNVFPVVEDTGDPAHSLMGKPCQKGYQSHYVMVNGPKASKDMGHVAPAGTTEEGRVADELVLFESAQAVPVYVLYV